MKDRWVFGTVGALPFAAGAFDMVVCCEVMEHLDEATFEAARGEIERVAAKYILVSVPYEERFWNERTRCDYCGLVGHYSSHLRRFSAESFRGLFPGCELVHASGMGPNISGYAPDWMYRLQYSLGAYQSRPWACERCGEVSGTPHPGLLGKIVRSATWRLEARSGSRPTWLMGAWKKQSDRAS